MDGQLSCDPPVPDWKELCVENETVSDLIGDGSARKSSAGLELECVAGKGAAQGLRTFEGHEHRARPALVFASLSRRWHRLPREFCLLNTVVAGLDSYKSCRQAK